MNTKSKPIIAGLIGITAALSERLADAAEVARQAHEAMAARQQNVAIGAVLPLQEMLPECQALFAALVALHRGSR